MLIWMNIAGLLLPKSIVAYLYDDFTLRQALEKMRYHGYTHLPVITRDNRYYGTISEGDLLWYFIDMNIPEVVDLLVSYNFLPVVDDRDSFVGIVTRNKILKKLSDANHGEKKVTTTISYGNPSLFTPNI